MARARTPIADTVLNARADDVCRTPPTRSTCPGDSPGPATCNSSGAPPAYRTIAATRPEPTTKSRRTKSPCWKRYSPRPYRHGVHCSARRNRRGALACARNGTARKTRTVSRTLCRGTGRQVLLPRRAMSERVGGRGVPRRSVRTATPLPGAPLPRRRRASQWLGAQRCQLADRQTRAAGRTLALAARPSPWRWA